MDQEASPMKLTRNELVERIPEEATCFGTAQWVCRLIPGAELESSHRDTDGSLWGHFWNRVNGEIVDIWSYRRGLPEGPDEV